MRREKHKILLVFYEPVTK